MTKQIESFRSTSLRWRHHLMAKRLFEEEDVGGSPRKRQKDLCRVSESSNIADKLSDEVLNKLKGN